MISQIGKRMRDFVALAILFVVAAAVAFYILQNQRLRIPVVEPKAFKLKAEFETAQAVTPGQGQTVRVSGVRIGDIGKVDFKQGRAVITMELDEKYKDLVRTDATGLLRPKTGLKDMFIELRPGSKEAPLAREGYTIPIANTLPDVNPDEILSALDADTRDYIKLLLNGAGEGLRGRGTDLRAALKRFEPTYRDIALVTGEVRKRRAELRRLINSLNRLNAEVATKDVELAQLVDSASRVFRSFASERTNVSAAVRELPGALRQASGTLAKVEEMAEILRPTSTKLIPVAHAMRRANIAVTPFSREAAPLLRRDIRPFVREARPFVRNLRPAAHDLVEAEPYLKRSFVVFNHLFNLLGYNRDGREPPEKQRRDEGYLFYLAWLQHQSAVLFGASDAHGPGRPLTTGGTCTTLAGTIEQQPELEFLLGLTGAFTDPRVCGGTPLPDLP